MSEPKQIGRYQIVQELGRGAMGRVFRAEDPTIRRPVAIKVISLSTGASPEDEAAFERSFQREIRSAGGLHHPGIVAIFDAGRQDDIAYIVMELVDGDTFERILHADPRPDIPVLLGICREVAVALDYAHAQGIVHRDIKPANILVTKDGTARVADFGIAKVPRTGTTISFSHTMVGAGTPEFMAPEQIRGATLDGRTDQWSLAIMAYRALTGAKPFEAEQMVVVLSQIMSVDPVPPSEVNPALPRQVDAVMAKALAKDPAERYPTCTEFLDALEMAYRMPVNPEPAAKSRVPIVLGGALFALAVAAMVLFLSRRHPEPPQIKPQVAAEAQASQPHSVTPQVPPAAQPRPKAEPAVRKMYQVQLVTDPADAELTVDNKPESACKSPCTLELAEGPHSVTVKKDGYHTVWKDFQATPDQAQLSIPLQLVTGTLLIDSQPPGAAVSVNGQPRPEKTPAHLQLPPGNCKIRVTMDGFDPYDFDVNVPADATREVSLTLAKSAR